MTVLGIDFSLARPDPRAVYAAGYRFVMGYLSAGGRKDLTAADIAAYRAAGLQVGLVWETTANRALSGAAGGSADGAAAEAEANRVGYPADCVIFAAVDFAATTGQIDGPIRAYMLAFSAATRRPAGVYGSYYVVSRLVTPGKPPLAYAWQTMAWSRDASGNDQLWQPGHLYQRLAHTWPISGVSISDWDENVLLNPLPLYGAAPAPDPGGDVPLTDADVTKIFWWTPFRGTLNFAQIVDAIQDSVDALAAKVGQPPQLDPAVVTAWLDANKDAIAAQVASLVLAGLNGAQINVAKPS